MTTATETLDRTGTWAIDPSHSSLEFVVRHAMVAKVRGRFTDFAGTLQLDETNPARSSADVVAQMQSVDTGNADRDNHLRTGDFFEVGTFPTMRFTSTSVVPKGPDTYVLEGDLTIRGVTNPVSFDIELLGTAVDAYGNTRLGFEGTTSISRKNWGLGWNAPLEKGAGVMVSDQVALTVAVSAIKQV